MTPPAPTPTLVECLTRLYDILGGPCTYAPETRDDLLVSLGRDLWEADWSLVTLTAPLSLADLAMLRGIAEGLELSPFLVMNGIWRVGPKTGYALICWNAEGWWMQDKKYKWSDGPHVLHAFLALLVAFALMRGDGGAS